MRLLSLTVRNYRVHKDTKVEFDPSRNLIGGANESGKSTLAEAAHRALFLRAKTGGAVHKEMLSTIHLGDPEVVLNFEAAGMSWELEKRFAGAKGSTRLTAAGQSALRDDEAETKLSELLGTESVGGRGASGQLPALWSHLWVWQGSSGDDPALHATTHKDTLVQRLQKDGVAAVMQSEADQRAAAKVAAAYGELFTGTGKPKAGSRPEIARLQLAESEEFLRKAEDASARLEQAVVDHSRAERKIGEAESSLPSLREQRTKTEAALNQVAELRREVESRQRAVVAATGKHEQLAKDDEKIVKLRTQIISAKEKLAPVEDELVKLSEFEQRARAASVAADRSFQDSSGKLRLARFRRDLTASIVVSFEKRDALKMLSERASEVDAIREKLNSVRSALAPLPTITAGDLAKLRKLDREASQAQATLEAMATGIDLLAASDTVSIDGKTLAAGESCVVSEDAELLIGDGTRLRIRPGGGTSLADARAFAGRAKETLLAALEAYTVGDLDQASSISEQRQSLQQQIERYEETLKALGGVKLGEELASATAESESAQAEVKRRLERLPEGSLFSSPQTLPEARESLSECQQHLAAAESDESTAQRGVEQLRRRHDDATKALVKYRDQVDASRQGLRDLETSLATLEDAHGGSDTRRQKLITARDEESEANELLAMSQRQLAELQPDILAADLDRFNRAIKQQEMLSREASDQLLVARDRLTLDGTSDPESDLQNARARRMGAREFHASEHRRALAIAKLHELFCSSREAIDRSLVEPLAERISVYLKCLFGAGAEARVNLTDSGIEGLDLVRPNDPAFGFTTLSGGAKEQVAAAARLALAEILAADHDGCLPVLFDDAFAYTDPERVQDLQRMLDLAAKRGLQVIILSCTPGDYSALGAKLISTDRISV